MLGLGDGEETVPESSTDTGEVETEDGTNVLHLRPFQRGSLFDDGCGWRGRDRPCSPLTTGSTS